MISIKVWNKDKSGILVYQVPPTSPHIIDVYDRVYFRAKEYRKDIHAHNEQLHVEMTQWAHISKMHNVSNDMYRHVLGSYLKRPLRPRSSPKRENVNFNYHDLGLMVFKLLLSILLTAYVYQE